MSLAEALVLVVDDEPSNRKLMEMVLRRDVRVMTAADGAEALELARRHQPEMVIADYKMPGMTGVELLTTLRAEQPDCLRLLITAYSDRDILEQAINQAGVYSFVRRPADPGMLRLQVVRALEHRTSERAARRRESLQLMGELAGSVAHDLSNYLLPVLIAPQELREGEGDDEEILRMLESAGVHLRAVCEEMRSISMGVPPSYLRIPTQPAELLEQTRLLCSGGVYAQATLDFELQPGLPSMGLCPGRVVRLLTNLVKNAAEATGPGGHVWVRLMAADHGLRIEVEDDGPGVPAAHRERLFEPNFTTKETGAGLGLANCRLIAAGHGGTIALEESPAGHTRFVVSLRSE